MARKSTLGGKTADKETPPSPTKMTEGDVHGSGAKSGQYPGERQHSGIIPSATEEVNTGQASEDPRGTDPALAGHYVHSDKSNAQGRAPGKTQVHNPNERLEVTIPHSAGQYPGIPVPIRYGEGFDGIAEASEAGDVQGDVTYAPQPRESGVGNVRGGQYPGIPQEWPFHGSADDTRGIEKNEGADLNLREVPEDDQNLGGRTVEDGNP
jgi:hypothetical protein